MAAKPYLIEWRLHPYRLLSHHSDEALLEVTLTNKSDKELLTSLVVCAPNALGFDKSAISHKREIRLGPLQPNQKYTTAIQIYSTQRTPPGHYQIRISAISHYRSYEYVLDEVRSSAALRIE